MSEPKKPVEYYLGLRYPFHVIADEESGYVIEFPDLPGCLTQVECLDEIPAMVEEVRRLWIEASYDNGMDIPEPSYPEEYSGKFNVRLPRKLHRALAEAAQAEGVSLNQYVVALLARGDAQERVERRLSAIESRLSVATAPAPELAAIGASKEPDVLYAREETRSPATSRVARRVREKKS